MRKKAGSSTTAKKKDTKKLCSACQKAKPFSSFYTSYNPLHKDGYTPMCKECIANACYDELIDEVDVEKLKSILRQLDKPFVENMWQAAIKQAKKLKEEERFSDYSNKSVIGLYFKNINTLHQVRSLNWSEGVEYNDSLKPAAPGSIEITRRKSTNYNEKVYYLHDESFEVTENIIKLFGEGYSAKEYELMVNYYNSLKQDYPSITEAQKKLLLRYVRFAAKEEVTTSLGQISEAEKWAKLASEALKQLNQSDLQGGISSFSEFFQKIERAKDIIPILPQYKYRPNDAPDFIIWCFINYCRRLEGKTECSYEDIYHFYDEKKREYIEQYGDPYGIFTNDTALNNREKIKEFIKLPPNFKNND